MSLLMSFSPRLPWENALKNVCTGMIFQNLQILNSETPAGSRVSDKGLWVYGIYSHLQKLSYSLSSYFTPLWRGGIKKDQKHKITHVGEGTECIVHACRKFRLPHHPCPETSILGEHKDSCMTQPPTEKSGQELGHLICEGPPLESPG